MKKLMMTIVGAVSAMVATAETVYVTAANFESCRSLQNGNTYRFAEDIDYTAGNCQSAMKVADGANVVMEIAKGVVVSLTGGAANGMTGAGAGIEVPANAKLVVAGSGELFATGGHAANGVDGAKGNAAVITDESYWYTTSGSGGNGGAGGGGAGAGIGGKGGAGGMGGAGAAGVTDNWSGSYMQSGAAGGAGGAGGQGKGCGTIEVGGTVTITAKGGGVAAKGGYGGAYSGREIAEGSTWYGAGYGGGGGGGGGGGVAASDIGGGGGGGGAGGGGGSGGICYFDDVDTVLMCKLNGDGGNGGKGVVGDVGFVNDYEGGFWTLFKDNLIWPGEETSAKINTVPYSSYTPGAGGAGGGVGATGGNGSLTVGLDASCICGTRSAYKVGKISDTEFIRWENEKLWRVVDGVYTEIPYETVNDGTGYLDGGKWYVVKDIVSRTASINVGEGEAANLVLLDRAALMVDCGQNFLQTGIWVPQGRALNVFGVASGALTATGGYNAAGIGGSEEGNGGTVTIYGGMVTATGGFLAAGIGGGYKGAGGSVTINGGTVTATGGFNAAGIGGGCSGAGGTVTINGGEVTATSVEGGAGIGSGFDGPSQVSLNLGPRVFKIGDNHYREGTGVSFVMPSTLRLVSATADNGAQVKISTMDETTYVSALSALRMTLTFVPGDVGYRCIDNDEVEVDLSDGSYTLSASDLPKVEEDLIAGLVEYLLPNGGAAEASGVRRINQAASQQSILSSGWYMATGEVTTSALNVLGTVNLILADGATLTVDGGIWVDSGKALNIFSQREATGKLIAIGSDLRAGISGDVTINGGEVKASSISNSPKTGLRVFKIDDNHYQGGVAVSFSMPPALCLSSAVADNGAQIKMATQDGVTSLYFLPAPRVTLNFALVDVDSHFVGDSVIALGPVGEDVTLEASDLPQVVENVIGSVAYVLPDGSEATAYDVHPVHQTDAFGTKLSDGWYVVTGTVTRTMLEVNGTVNLILADGAKLSVANGVRVAPGNTLNVFCQQEGTGQLVATGSDRCAGIGGGDQGTGGTVTINGGMVTATGGNLAAGIGGGTLGSGGTVTINGGVVTATGTDGGAGIGGGFKGAGGTVTINGISSERSESPSGDGYQGCTVTATGGDLAAGIGGGTLGSGGTVTINGGTVTATGGENAAGIGGGYDGAGGTVTITGGEVTATGNDGGAGIGGGCDGADGTVTLDETKVEVVEGAYGNGSGYVKIAEKGPKCEGGEIVEGEGGVWVVTPNVGATEVTITGLPDGDTVAVPPTVTQVCGVDDGKIRIQARVADAGGVVVTHDITGAFTVSGGAIALDPNGLVTIGDETIPVKPVIGDLGVDATEPFVVGDTVAVTIRAIPGLKYSLIRGVELGAITTTVVEPTLATETQMTLEDANPPSGAAFYRVAVGK